MDPDLPASLLPADWPGPAARAVFVDVYDGLGPLAEDGFRAIVAEDDRSVAALGRHHSAKRAAKVSMPGTDGDGNPGRSVHR